MVLAEGAPASISLLVRELKATFTRKAVGMITFTFADLPGMAAVVARAAAEGEGETYVARSVGRMQDGSVVAEFDVTWAFKRR
jgi:hypothetical protein